MLTTDSLLGKVLDIHVRVCGQLLQHRLYLCLKGTWGQRQMNHLKKKKESIILLVEKTSDADGDHILLFQDRAYLLKGLGHIEAYIGHLVIGHLEDHW